MPVRSIPVSFVLGILLVLGATTAAFAQQTAETPVVTVPRLITVNGVLRPSLGLPSSGVVGVRFALYRDPQGGTPIWTEIQNVQTDEQGRYTLWLGATQGAGLPLDLFTTGEPRWLGVQVQSPGEEEQARVLLVSVPYALKAADADTIGGKPVSAFVLADALKDGKVLSSAVTMGATKDGPASFALSGTGTANMIPKWLDGAGTLTDSAIFDSGGSVGIGTTTPIGTLNVTKSGAPNYLTLSSYQADTLDKGFLLRTARGTSGSPLPVQSGNALFNMYGQGHDGVDYGLAAGISMAVDGAVSAGKVPGAILLQTSDSNGAFAERMRVNAAGDVGIGTTTPAAKLDVNGTIKGTTFAGDGSALTNIATTALSNDAVTSAKIADSTIVDADVSPAAAINRTKIAGTAATLNAASTFTEPQSIQTANTAPLSPPLLSPNIPGTRVQAPLSAGPVPL